MDAPELIVETEPDPRDCRFLEDRINEFNIATTRIPFGGKVGIFARDEHGEIIAGLYGWCWGGCLFVDALWVRDEMRGRGYGTRLLATAEREAVTRGCRWALLNTHSFQAPDFYRRHGYSIYGAFEGYPEGHAHFHLSKRLDWPSG